VVILKSRVDKVVDIDSAVPIFITMHCMKIKNISVPVLWNISNKIEKELSLGHKFSFCKTYIFATLWCKTLIFQTYII